jgi:2-succinyl-5-enolpyruvyl-6-hydroxy-3-cyclohexene-1-carboxylate synthase
LSEGHPPGAVLFCGNSLAVRDFDAFARPAPTGLCVLHQRGLAGIDGLIAGAAGARSVLAEDRVVMALIGDVSALHDIGSLRVAADARGPLVLIVIENGGGQIFSELPLANAPRAERDFERLFLTPPGPAFASAARAFGIDCVEVDTSPEFERALATACAAHGTSVIVARVDPRSSARHRRSLLDPPRRAREPATPENRHEHA